MVSVNEIAALKASVDLVALAIQDTPLKRVGAYFEGPCPLCRQGVDCFQVHAEKGWICRKHSSRYRDAIAYVQERDSVGFLDACRKLDKSLRCDKSDKGDKSSQHDISGATEASQGCDKSPPSEDWQRRALSLVEDCEKRLWLREGEKARLWLKNRGLQEATLRRWRLGYNPGGYRFGFRTDRGIAIPWELGGFVTSTSVDLQAGQSTGRFLAGHLSCSAPRPCMGTGLLS